MLGNIGVSECLIILVVLGVISSIIRGFRGSRVSRASTMTPDEQTQYQRILTKLDKQEQRMENLETIMEGSREKAPARDAADE